MRLFFGAFGKPLRDAEDQSPAKDDDNADHDDADRFFRHSVLLSDPKGIDTLMIKYSTTCAPLKWIVNVGLSGNLSRKGIFGERKMESIFRGENARKKMAPEEGFEPSTNRLTADRSTTELLGNVNMAAEPGLEPGQKDSKSFVLPLHNSATASVLVEAGAGGRTRTDTEVAP